MDGAGAGRLRAGGRDLLVPGEMQSEDIRHWSVLPGHCGRPRRRMNRHGSNPAITPLFAGMCPAGQLKPTEPRTWTPLWESPHPRPPAAARPCRFADLPAPAAASSTERDLDSTHAQCLDCATATRGY